MILFERRTISMQYMNSKKRNLILWSSIVNLLTTVANFVLSILVICDVKGIEKVLQYISLSGISITIWSAVINFACGLVASVLLFYSIREKGKYFRQSAGVYLAGFIMIIIFGSFLAWALLIGSAWVPDVIVMNTPKEVRQEEVMQDRAYEEKKRKIEELKQLRDSGAITEEEYKQKLFELL